MSMTIKQDDIQAAIIKYIDEKVAAEFEEVKQKMIEDFASKIENKRAEIVSGVALRMMNHIQFETHRDQIIITIEDRRS